MPRGRKKQNLTLPLIPLRGLTVFPNMVIHFDIGRPASVAALGSAMMKDQQVFLVAQIDPGVEEPEEKDLYTVGTMARVKPRSQRRVREVSSWTVCLPSVDLTCRAAF